MAAPTSVALCEFSCNGVCDKLQMKISPILFLVGIVLCFYLDPELGR